MSDPADIPDLSDIVRRLDAILADLRDRSSVLPEGLAPIDAATFIGTSVAKLHDMNGRGLMPAPVEVGDGGRCPRFLRSELSAWMRAGCPSRVRWNLQRDAALRRVG